MYHQHSNQPKGIIFIVHLEGLFFHHVSFLFIGQNIKIEQSHPDRKIIDMAMIFRKLTI